MPQLDFGILFIQLFFNFIFFWFIYFFNLYKVFPNLNKTIKYRKYKIKDISKKSFIIEKNIFFLFSLIKNSKNINDSLFLNILNNKKRTVIYNE